jgi:hypothetical protein
MTMMSKLRKTAAGVLALSLLAFALAPSAAIGQVSVDCETPTGDQYEGADECIEENTGTGTGTGSGGDPADPPVLERNVGPLPFTGFDVIAMTAVALAVAGLGLLLQRAVARQAE